MHSAAPSSVCPTKHKNHPDANKAIYECRGADGTDFLGAKKAGQYRDPADRPSWSDRLVVGGVTCGELRKLPQRTDHDFLLTQCTLS